jgi:hypothetical protein
MAYNRENFLKGVLIVQDIYLQHSDSGLNNREIFKRYVNPSYPMTERTFYEYLAINARKELKELQEVKRLQMSLF